MNLRPLWGKENTVLVGPKEFSLWEAGLKWGWELLMECAGGLQTQPLLCSRLCAWHWGLELNMTRAFSSFLRVMTETRKCNTQSDKDYDRGRYQHHESTKMTATSLLGKALMDKGSQEKGQNTPGRREDIVWAVPLISPFLFTAKKWIMK